MKSYYVKLTAEQKLRLEQEGIELVSLGDGWLIDSKEDLEKALEVLCVKEGERQQTQYENVVSVNFCDVDDVQEATEDTVNISFSEGFGCFEEKFAKRIQNQFLMKLGLENSLSVVVHDRSDKRHDPIRDDRFHIHMWSAPEGSTYVSAPKKIWGFEVSTKKTAWSCPDIGKLIYDNLMWPVAGLIDNNLYIFHAINRKVNKDSLRIFKQIMQETAEIYQLDEQEYQQYLEKRKAEAHEASRKLYVDSCVVDLGAKVSEHQQIVESARAKLQEAEKLLTQTIRDAKMKEEALDRLLDRQSEQAELLGKEFSSLLSAPHIVDITMADGVLYVYTDTIRVRDPRTSILHEIGRFRIALYYKREEPFITMHNMDRRVYYPNAEKYMNGIHVSSNGGPCFGNIKKDMVKLLTDYRFSEAVIMAIRSLETVNVDDSWGRNIDQWPAATEATT